MSVWRCTNNVLSTGYRNTHTPTILLNDWERVNRRLRVTAMCIVHKMPSRCNKMSRTKKKKTSSFVRFLVLFVIPYVKRQRDIREKSIFDVCNAHFVFPVICLLYLCVHRTYERANARAHAHSYSRATFLYAVVIRHSQYIVVILSC